MLKKINLKKFFYFYAGYKEKNIFYSKNFFYKYFFPGNFIRKNFFSIKKN